MKRQTLAGSAATVEGSIMDQAILNTTKYLNATASFHDLGWGGEERE